MSDREAMLAALWLRESMNLDVSRPEEVVAVLTQAVEQYRASHSELSAAWQDPGAGRIWASIAKILEGAEVKIREALSKEGFQVEE